MTIQFDNFNLACDALDTLANEFDVKYCLGSPMIQSPMIQAFIVKKGDNNYNLLVDSYISEENITRIIQKGRGLTLNCSTTNL